MSTRRYSKEYDHDANPHFLNRSHRRGSDFNRHGFLIDRKAFPLPRSDFRRLKRSETKINHPVRRSGRHPKRSK